MKPSATIGDNCVDIYPQLNKAFSAVMRSMWRCTALATAYSRDALPGGDDDYGTKLKQDPRPHGRRYQPCPYRNTALPHKLGWNCTTMIAFGDYTEGVMADFALSEEDYRSLAQ